MISALAELKDTFSVIHAALQARKTLFPDDKTFADRIDAFFLALQSQIAAARPPSYEEKSSFHSVLSEPAVFPAHPVRQDEEGPGNAHF